MTRNDELFERADGDEWNRTNLVQQRDTIQTEVERLGDLCDALLCEKSVAEAQRDALKAENEQLKTSAAEVAKLHQPRLEQEMEIAVRIDALKAALTTARAAINPSDLDGISLHEWNGRLKTATQVIDAALVLAEDRNIP